MINPHEYAVNLSIADKARNIDGSIVECGTWKGGMIAGICTLFGNHKNYYLFDSFEGLPKASAIDGNAALKWQSEINSESYYNNCSANEDDADCAMRIAKAESYFIKKGWFEDTLPTCKFPEGISLLRLDADWYKSTTEILNSLFPLVNPGGIILVDDYYSWEGCSKALHDYLSKNQRAERIHSLFGVCYLIKMDN